MISEYLPPTFAPRPTAADDRCARRSIDAGRRWVMRDTTHVFLVSSISALSSLQHFRVSRLTLAKGRHLPGHTLRSLRRGPSVSGNAMDRVGSGSQLGAGLQADPHLQAW